MIAFAASRGQKIASRFKLLEGLAQVDDVDAITGIKDELLHLRVPPFGLVSKMDARLQ